VTLGEEPPPDAATVMFPIALPIVDGANCTVKLVLPPPGSESGTEMPLALKPAPPALTCEIVMVEVPELVTVTVCLPVLPNGTLPNATFAGFNVSDALPLVPLPARFNTCGEFAAASVKVIDPVALPEAVGENRTENERLCPAPIVIGNESPLIAKALPAMVARFKTTLAFSLLVSCTIWVMFWPTATLPKLKDEGETVRPAPG
jgi:hypothetical protein